MEPGAILDMVINAPKNGYIIGAIVSDDDSTMKAQLKHKKNPQNPKDKGKLPLWIPEPTFLADPSHRVKSVAKHFYSIRTKPLSRARIIARRMKKNWGYMIAQNKNSTIEQFVAAAKAPLEHMFDNHVFCDKWCAAKRVNETSNDRIYLHPEGFLSKEKTDELKIYCDLQKITEKYGSEFFLMQSLHPFNTQTNESLNQSQAMLTPKNKMFHSTKAFHHRHSIMIGSHNWGFRRYWEETFAELGIKISDKFSQFLQRVDDSRKRNKETKGKTEVKRKRKFRQDAVEKKLLDEKRTLNIAYKSGIGLDIGYKAQGAETAPKPPVCKWCGLSSHKTKRSNKCLFNPANVAKKREVVSYAVEHSTEKAVDV